jgi:hypothetical protein
MSDSTGPVYEVTHTIDREIVDDFDRWLEEHVAQMLGIPGLDDARVYVADGDDEQHVRRVTQYLFDSDSSLETYLAEQAAAMRRSADEHFPDRFEVSRRILRDAGVIDAVEAAAERCLNCSTPLTGQYCGNCGQRARSRLISIWELLRDAFGDLLELDSRLWQTLVPLMIRPGQLTRDYLEGRRARFMPPFRTYLVLSILFFVIAFFDPREQFDVFFDEEPPTAEESANAQAADEIIEDVRQELADEGLLAQEPPVPGPQPDAGDETADEDEESGGFNIRFTDGGTESSGDCDSLEDENTPPWLASWLTPERMKVICERTTADGGRAFGDRLLDTTPSALIFLLPLMAFVLKLLYPLSRRYYVEHLLFVVHYHAFVFLILTLQILFGRLVAVLTLPGFVSAIATAVVVLYVPIYLYKAMRCVYGQGWILSSLKFTALAFSYFTGLIMIIGFTAIYAAFSL